VTTANAPKTQLGRYQLVRHLASGGMADLWLARATGIEGFERHVAIKRIRKEQARDQRFVQMFLDEARLAASLHHNNIATVHDIGQMQGEYFFAMEWVHGEDLRRVLMHASAREQHLPIEHVMTVVLAVTAALHYAHEHKSQIVHRDVSPANIIVGYDGNVKVVDFGIAKAAHRGKETQSGVMKGKVAYMSPEQCVGQPVDRRSDIFSLGIVLYELVTVRRLFKAANDFLTMSAIIHGDIPPPSTIRPGVPRELEAIIMKALSPERDDRFRSAEDMRAALERFCAANHIRTSSTVLADYMRAMFGQKPEPWLVDGDGDMDVSIDFDGTQSGIVRVPEAALKRHAVPATTPVQPNAPIMRARTKAITGQPPLSTPAQADAEATDIVAPLPLDLTSGDFAELPQTDGPLSVGDDTLMIRSVTVATGHGKHIAMIVVVAAALIVGAFFLIRAQQSDDDDPRYQANPNIKLPPPSNPVVVQPVATPDAAEEVEEVVIEEDVADGSGSSEPATEPPTKKKKNKKIRKTGRRPPRDTQKPPPDEEPTDGNWDPDGLFPKK
jgi:serine/threonine protein kinase